MKRAGNQIIVRQKKGCFFRKRVLHEMYGKEQCWKKKQKRVNCVKLKPIIYIKGNCYETPLYDHVLGNKWNGDKNEIRELGGAPEGGGVGEGRGDEKG